MTSYLICNSVADAKTNKFNYIVNLQFSHDIGAVIIYRFMTEEKLITNLFIG